MGAVGFADDYRSSSGRSSSASWWGDTCTCFRPTCSRPSWPSPS
jgi:hypothetical protein